MIMTHTDLIIIGAGPGGYSTATYAAKHGLKVVIVEKEHLGGTCLNAGCIPTKCYVHDAELLRNPLLDEQVVKNIDFKRIVERKNNVILQLRGAIETLMSQPGITLVRGKAEFIDNKTVEVNGEQYSANNIIIATGSHSKMPPFAPKVGLTNGVNVVTSTELLSIDYIPKRLAIVGAGVIGMEFASAFAAFGSEVNVYEFLKECLPPMDKDIAKRLRKTLEKRGINFHMKYSVNNVEELNADTVLIATGRAANVDGLGLEKTGIEYSPKGIAVDDNMKTNVEGIYATGDVNGRMMLAHAAEWQGKRAVNSILGLSDNIRFDIMPSAVFTYPEAASVGPTEEALKAQGKAYKTIKGFYRANGKALTMEETEGMMKLLTDDNGKILACHIYGAHSADIVQEVAVLMNEDATVDTLRDIIHIHPTLSEVLSDAVR